MLQNFVRDLRDMPEQLQAATPAPAKRMLHTLKGLAATLGATELAGAAASAEKALAANLSEAPGAPPTLQACQAIADALPGLQTLLEAMQQDAAAPRPDGVSQGAPALERPALVLALQTLTRLLQASDMDSMAAMTDVEQRFGSALGEELEALSDAVAEMAFDQALPLCRALLEKYSG